MRLTDIFPLRTFTPGRLPTRPLDYRPDVDGLRAVAVLAVVAFHAFPNSLPGGFVGVDVFFVISGFLISSIIMQELAAGRFSFLMFYARRARRIFPALIVLLVVVCVLGWLVLLPDEYQLLGMHTAAGSGFALNLILYRDFSRYFEVSTQPLLHLWSLGVEEQFYLLWPLFMAAIWRVAGMRLTLIIAAAVLSFVMNVTEGLLSSFYLPSSRLWELAVGGALAQIRLNHVPGSEPSHAEAVKSWLCGIRAGIGHQVQGALGAILLAVSFASFKSEYLPAWYMLVPVTGALLLISAGMKSWVNRFLLSSPALVLIGLISYPLYLWHWPLLTFARAVWWGSFTSATALGVITVSLVAALLTYKYVELPLRSSAKITPVAVSLCAAMILCGGTGYLIATQRIAARPVDNAVKRLLGAAMEDWPPKSVDWDHVDRLLFVGKGSRKVLFIGDSNMFQYYSRIDQLLSDHPSNTHGAVFAASSGCALGAIEIERYPSCRAYLQKAIEYARGPDVDSIVIGASWFKHFTRYRDSDDFGEPAPLRLKTDDALDALRRTVAELVWKGKRVYIVLQIPLGADVDPRRAIRRTVLPPGFTVMTRPVAKAKLLDAIEPIDTKLRRVASDTGAIVIDPVDSLCDDSTCPTISTDGEPVYFDSSHLLPSYVRHHVRYLDKTLLDAS